MPKSSSLLVTLMELKKYQEIAFYDLLLSSECQSLPEVVHSGSYWLNHIHIVDKIFRAHLCGKRHSFISTVSDDIPRLQLLRQEAINSNDWLIDYAGSLNADTASERIQFAFTDGVPGDMTREEILLHLLTHASYHLSTCIPSLEKNGLTMPPMLLTTMLSSSRMDSL
ncbi:DinB family protein [Pectobacterium betavasculorum]|uniref:DinB family protein n=1 Tax=Pectobacterium betavasculorum TaxID=55207 RepID=UPI0006922A26|nr:DinB family protein [Pectobacterium betavasculorum]